MKFFGLFWVVSAVSSVWILQTPLRILEDVGRAIPTRAVVLNRVNFIEGQRSLFAPLAPPTGLRAASSGLTADPATHFHQAADVGLEQFMNGLFRPADAIRRIVGLVTPVVTVVAAENSCAASTSNRHSWHSWIPKHTSLLSRSSRSGHCTELWQTDWSQAEPIDRVFQVQVRGQLIVEVPTYAEAEAIARQLRHILDQPDFMPYRLAPALVNGVPVGKAGDRVVFTVNPEWSRLLDRNPELLAIDGVNHLRVALNVPPLPLAQAQSQMYGLIPTQRQLTGVASWYGPYFHGRLTATGEVFDQHELTAAHPSLPFNTYLKVTSKRTGRAVIVRINDRGPYFDNRSLDLSLEAARCLGGETDGVVPYEAVVMQKHDLAQPRSHWALAEMPYSTGSLP
jgi:hypothetical protein